jgi:hypothetical protein
MMYFLKLTGADAAERSDVGVGTRIAQLSERLHEIGSRYRIGVNERAHLVHITLNRILETDPRLMMWNLPGGGLQMAIERADLEQEAQSRPAVCPKRRTGWHGRRNASAEANAPVPLHA